MTSGAHSTFSAPARCPILFAKVAPFFSAAATVERRLLSGCFLSSHFDHQGFLNLASGAIHEFAVVIGIHGAMPPMTLDVSH